MTRRSKCLVLSAHDGLIDRRIIAQVNHLAASGRDVTLVSVPARGVQSLTREVRVAMAGGAGGDVAARPGDDANIVRRLARRLPGSVKGGIRAVGWRLGHTPLRRFGAYFQAHTPAEAYDVIHCHDLQTLPAGLEIRKELAPGAKVIYDSHELFPAQFPAGRLRRYWEQIETLHIREADGVITVNESIAQLLAERYGIARPVVLYNSCHLSSMPLGAETFRRHFGLGPEGGSPREGEAFAVMFQGGFLREKNVEALARAFVDLGPAYQLFLLGGGILEPRLKRMIKESAAANVHLGEWVEAEQLLGYLGHVHAGVIPYLDDGLPNNHYCTPNKLFEYLEAGLPICANELPELWRIVQGEGIGRTYPLNTTEEIAGAITDFAARYRAGEFEASAFAKARATYAWSKQAERLLALYEQLGV